MRSFPKLPTKISDFISYLTKNPNQKVSSLLEPFKDYERTLRETFAQDQSNLIIKDNYVNAVPLFADSESELTIRARNLESEDEAEKGRYIMPLSDKMRKSNGALSVVGSLKDFQKNFSIFSESALSELDWNNVVAAGSSVLTPLLPIPVEHAGSRKALRDYYHTKFAPSSDVDLFLYGLNEEQALEKIKQIESSIKDSILTETTTIRTRNAITIVSKYPTRHVQIVLRIYSSLSEIITGFDVDSSCVAYDGKQVYASPRAIAALVTQVNHVDLTRRSPSYESRLSKYSKRGFEVYWSELDRSLVDPTIFERSFARTLGLARLLVLEKLPTEEKRNEYVNVRRTERGRPQAMFAMKNKHSMRGNIKDNFDDVADWAYEDDVSNYHSFTIPYGEKFTSRRIERLLYTKDLLLNAEWNVKKDRKVNLHRHPAFFGDAADIFEDCCGHCPKPANEEEERVAQEESKNYVSGRITFLTDDPGRQEIGSFNPITDQDWTEMAYVTETGRLAKAIVDQNLVEVETLLDNGVVDPNARDYTGRTMLHLAITTSTADIVKSLLDHGAYVVPRLTSGETAMHLAAGRGDVDIIELLHEKSDKNKADVDKKAREEPDLDVVEHSDAEDDASEASAETSNFVKVESADKFMKDSKDDVEVVDVSKIEPKDDILDPDAVAWDLGCTPQHIATVFGHVEALKYLLEEFGGDPRIPIKIKDEYTKLPSKAILSLVLALHLPLEKSEEVTQALLSAGASCSQADLQGSTAFQYFANASCDALEILLKHDKKRALSVLNHIGVGDSAWNFQCRTALTTAIGNRDEKTALRLLDFGAKHEITVAEWHESYQRKFKGQTMYNVDNRFREECEQPILLAIKYELPAVVRKLVELGTNINNINCNGQKRLLNSYTNADAKMCSVLDSVTGKIEELKAYKPTEVTKPEAPEYVTEYMEKYPEGSYGHWIVHEKYEHQKANHEGSMKNYERQLKQKAAITGSSIKEKAIADLLQRFQFLEAFLLEKEAKTYIKLHVISDLQVAMLEAQTKTKEVQELELKNPALEEQVRRGRLSDLYDVKFPEIPETKLDDAKRLEYLKLFSAAWDGDFETIRQLTTAARGENEDKAPLKIGARDSKGFNLFTIAIMRGHVDVAFKMVPIAQAQYQPKDTKLSYTMNDTETDYERDDYDSNDSENESEPESQSDTGEHTGLQLYSRLPAAVRDQFTIEDIGQISTSVKSEISPVSFITHEAQIGAAIRQKISVIRNPATVVPYQGGMFNLAIYSGDVVLFNKLLDAAMEYQKLMAQTDDAEPTQFVLPETIFNYALQTGRTEFLSIMMSRTCAGLPLAQLAEKSGVKADDSKPKYYPGLSIRGKKNENWAASYRGGLQPAKNVQSLLNRAASYANVETLEWLLSDTPIRLWKEYAAKNENDDRLKLLLKTEAGFEKVVAEWLDKDRNMTLHLALSAHQGCQLSNNAKENAKLWDSELEKAVSSIIRAIPESINAKLPTGLNPINHAVFVRRLNLAKIILEAGGDINRRDNNGNNIMHSMLGHFISRQSEQYRTDYQAIEQIIQLIGEDKCRELLLSRNKSHHSQGNGRTAFHAWIFNIKSTSGCECGTCGLKTLELLLKYAPEAITMLDSSGDTPVHTVILYPNAKFLKKMLEVNPDALLRENAVGQTPFDLAKRLYLASKVKDPPTLVDTSNRWRGYYYSNAPNTVQNVIERSEESFVNEAVRDQQDVVWEICVEHAKQHEIKRRLVSLNEANEVAKRLSQPVDDTAAVSQRHYFGRDGDYNGFDNMPHWSSYLGGSCPGKEGEDESDVDENENYQEEY